jgi:regulator of sigma E protease
MAKFFKLRVDEFGFGFPPKIKSKKIGETEYSLNLIPFGGFVKIYGESDTEGKGDISSEDKKKSFYYLSSLKKVAILVAGVTMNFLIGWFAFSAIVFMTGVGVPYKVLIAEVVKGGPADIAGIRQNDEIIGFSESEKFIGIVNQNVGRQMEIDVLRNGEKLVFQTTPRVNPPANEGKLGLKLSEEFNFINKYDLLTAFSEGGKTALRVSFLILYSILNLFKGMFTGDWSVLSTVSGPVAVYGVLGEASRQGILYLLQLLGLISLNLAVVNLLPIPALDGGRVVFIIFRKIFEVFGRNISYNFEMAAHSISLILLLILMVIITIRDVLNII